MTTKRTAGNYGRRASVPGEKNTKEKILDAAITQFSERGYDCVSIRDIAGAVGIRESAIYRHYTSKEHIMDSIIESLVASFETEPGMASIDTLLEKYGPTGLVDHMARTTMVRMKEPQIRKISRLLCIELYRNEKIRDFFRHTFMEPSYRMWKQLFTEMTEKGHIGKCDADEIAAELANYSMYLYFDGFLVRYDETSFDSIVDEMTDDLSRHIRFVFKTVSVNETLVRKGRKKAISHE